MKLLRALYLVLASIILLPIIVLIEVLFLGWVVYCCSRMDQIERSFEVWYRYLLAGIQMNMDFVKNGLK